MIALKQPLILASGSPRRKEILNQMNLPHTVDVSDADESYISSPEEMVLELSKRKAEAVSIKHPDSLILAADTLVFGQTVLGKPNNAEHAKEMLRLNLQNAKAMGIEKLLVTCNVENEASERTILANGGVFEMTIDVDGDKMKRYWITVGL